MESRDSRLFKSSPPRRREDRGGSCAILNQWIAIHSRSSPPLISTPLQACSMGDDDNSLTKAMTTLPNLGLAALQLTVNSDDKEVRRGTTMKMNPRKTE
ncbi:nucleocapsid protein [Sesbania bispinosa]|nr:nucleocapsid protein [Sesbania bispinosa]